MAPDSDDEAYRPARHVCIAAQMIGLPGLNGLRIYIRSARDKSIHAQGLIVDGFVYLLEIGQAEQAVDWARGLRDDLRAVRSEKVLHLDTLARLLLVLGEVEGARSTIEKIPEAQRTADHRAVLAQLMAAQGNFPGVVCELEEVLAGQSGTWPKDLPPKEKLLQLLDDWRDGRATEPVPFRRCL